MTGEHLEQAQVVLIELVEAELGDDDRADHARPVVKRHREQRFIDRFRARNRLRELALRGVARQNGLAGGHDVTRDAVADWNLEHIHRLARRRGEIPAERDRHDHVTVDDEHATVVVIDQRAQLVGDRHADLADIVQAVQLAREALQHLQVRDRADVAHLHAVRFRPLVRAVAEMDEMILAARLRGHHRRFRAGDQLAWVAGVRGSFRETHRKRQPAGRTELLRRDALFDPLGQTGRAHGVGDRHDHGELLTAEAAHDVRATAGRAQRVGELGEDLVTDRVPVHIVRALEVVDVEHQHSDGLV